ncbi:unnamed protein product [Haemonchus placei]|uniref:Major sperm protein n=1 Tax=Haemonchus placei TaxID=6290 RepID=A0A0N4W606_HAEPC|nr:unnamed protein product [Haemonchus placei]
MAAAATAEPSTTAADKLSFVPSKSVTFMPNTSKQMAEMAITNESDKNVMFKMKSTRPGMFKMRPVYGVIPPNGKKLLEGEVGKRKFRILFFGINDKEEEEEEAKEAERKAEEMKKDKDGKGGEKEIIERVKEKIVIQKEVVQAPQKKLVMVMYRDPKAPESSSADEEEGDETDATLIPQPEQQKGASKPPSTGTQPASKSSQPPPAGAQPAAKSAPSKGAQPPSKASQPPSKASQPSPAKQSPATQPSPSQAPAKSGTTPSAGPAKSAPAPGAAPAAAPAAGQKKVEDDLAGLKTCRMNVNFQQRPAEPAPKK